MFVRSFALSRGYGLWNCDELPLKNVPVYKTRVKKVTVVGWCNDDDMTMIKAPKIHLYDIRYIEYIQY